MTASNRSASTMPCLQGRPGTGCRGASHTHPTLGIGYPQHVQQEGEVTPGPGRDGTALAEPVMRIAGGKVVAPVLQAEMG